MKSIRESIYRASQSTSFYGVAYLLCIPVFAFFYWCFFTASFHAPYAKLEAAATSDLRNAGMILDAALHRTLGQKTLETKGWKLRGFNLRDVRATDNGGIRFEIAFQFTELPDAPSSEGDNTVDRSPGTKGLRSATIQTFVRANMPGNGQTQQDVGGNTTRFYRVLYIQPNEELASRDEFYKSAYSFLTPLTSVDKGRLIWLSQEENDPLNLLFGGLGGDPTTFSGGFWRMAYFSATVITTIGFGDIVPLTPMARLTAAFEGVLGITLAGLFVNAATRRRETSNDDS